MFGNLFRVLRHGNLTPPREGLAGFANGDIVITVSPRRTSKSATFDDLLNSEFLGMWRDRADIDDSLEFARKLRSDGWNNSAP